MMSGDFLINYSYIKIKLNTLTFYYIFRILIHPQYSKKKIINKKK